MKAKPWSARLRWAVGWWTMNRANDLCLWSISRWANRWMQTDYYRLPERAADDIDALIQKYKDKLGPKTLRRLRGLRTGLMLIGDRMYDQIVYGDRE